MNKRIGNTIKLYIFVILLGITVGVVLWCFMKAVSVSTRLLWEVLPEKIGLPYTPVIICAIGGLIAGLLHRKYGDYPEELPVVLGKIKKEKHYDYHPMPVILACAFLPLILGASVGPEAGLTGIVAGLCYWISDNVKYAKIHEAEYSEIGSAVMLGTLFGSPLFGIFAVEENPEEGEKDGKLPVIPKLTKLILYGLSTAAAFGTMKGLSALFGKAAEGFPSFEWSRLVMQDYLMIPVYVICGLAVFLAFKYATKITGFVGSKIPVFLKEVICGICVGITAMLVPAVLFSGEDQMALLPETVKTVTPIILIGICALKIIMTALCIEFGLKGGHFFPLIYACCCIGFALSTVTDVSPVFASAIITASTMGAQLKKPLAVAMLLLICFPLKVLLWILLAAAICSKIGARAGRTDGSVD